MRGEVIGQRRQLGGVPAESFHLVDGEDDPAVRGVGLDLPSSLEGGLELRANPHAGGDLLGEDLVAWNAVCGEGVGLWRADLFLGSVEMDYWVGTTVKINPTGLQGDRGLRVGVVPASQGKSDLITMDDRRNLVVCPRHMIGRAGPTLRSWTTTCW